MSGVVSPALNECDNGGLALSAGAYEGEPLSSLHHEVQFLEHGQRGPRRVPKSHVAEFDALRTTLRAWQWFCLAAIAAATTIAIVIVVFVTIVRRS